MSLFWFPSSTALEIVFSINKTTFVYFKLSIILLSKFKIKRIWTIVLINSQEVITVVVFYESHVIKFANFI